MIRKYFVAWFGMMVLAVINGTIRDFVYKPHMDPLSAHQLSTLFLLMLMAGYFWWLRRRWPLASAQQAWLVGIIWFVMTEAFEFGLGLRRGTPWSEMFAAYNVFAGQAWAFIPLWVLVGPYVFHRFVKTRAVKQ